MEETNLSNGWTWKKIGDVAFVTKLAGFEFTKYVKYSDTGEIPVIRAQNVTKSGFQDGNYHYVSRELLESLQRSRVRGGEILMVFVGSVGNVGLVPEGKDYFLGPNVAKIKIEDRNVSNKFVLYYLLSDNGKGAIINFSKSTVQGSISMGNIREIPLPIPPLPEQERIVAKIEDLFTQLEAGTAALKRVQAGLKRYKAAVLKAAVEGRLVDGRLVDGDSGKRVLENGELPERWKWVTIEQVSKNIVDCLHSTPTFTDRGKYCVDTTWIEPGKLISTRARLVSEETFQNRIRRLEPKAGDILFSREGTIGTALTVPENIELCLGQRMMMFRPNSSITSKYLEWTIQSPVFQNQWRQKIIGTTAPHINIGDIRQFVLSLPPLEEQHLIVSEIEQRLSMAEVIESVVESSLKRAGRLRHAILKRAFEGRLV